MTPIRILITDDSVVNRELLKKHLAAVSGFEVVATARDGAEALKILSDMPVDIVVLDVEMPVLDGLQTLQQLRRRYPRLPVIMFSTLTERGASITIHALSLGANDYVPKPTITNSSEELKEYIQSSFVPRIRSLCRKVAPVSTPPAPKSTSTSTSRSTSAPLQTPAAPRPPRPARPRSAKNTKIKMIGLGISTGGPNALAQLLPRLPQDFPVPILIVQHMLPLFTKPLAERLDTLSSLKVVEARSDIRPEAGTVYIAPGDFHLVLARQDRSVNAAVSLQLNQGPTENSCRPAVDVLFHSLAQVYGAGALGLIMTGMGNDGLRGCREIHAAGGLILAQDEASSTIWGMPGHVVKAELADRVLSLDELAPELIRLVRLNI